MYVPKAGLEPARGFPHCPLKTACLPVPPLRLNKIYIHSTLIHCKDKFNFNEISSTIKRCIFFIMV